MMILTHALPLLMLALPLAQQQRPPVPPTPAPSPTPARSHQFYTLDNGLEVILQRDEQAPTVHVAVWYRVGSKDEVPGRTGFAHLFEHMMFQGTKHIPEDAYFSILGKAGASERNGTTDNDRTLYYQTVPSNQLELALWLESSRMGFLLQRPALQATFENQREVVKNERRQRIDNAPMGGVFEVQLDALFPEGHPYRHDVIGSMEDLSAASVQDIRDFFNRYYAPNNAVIVIAGAFDPDHARALVEKYFGPVPAGAPITPRQAAKASLDNPVRRTMEARVNLPAGYLTWHTTAALAEDEPALDLLAEILTGGKASRLHRRLVHEMKAAESVSAYQWGLQLAGLFEIAYSALPGHELASLEGAVMQELERLQREPVAPEELERAKNRVETRMLGNLETLEDRAQWLLTYHVLARDADYLDRHLARYRQVTPEKLQAVARKYISPRKMLAVTVTPNEKAPIKGRMTGTTGVTGLAGSLKAQVAR